MNLRAIAARCVKSYGGFILGIDFVLKDTGSSDELLTLISDVRQELRNNKQYKLSDKIRNQLTDLGYEISD